MKSLSLSAIIFGLFLGASAFSQEIPQERHETAMNEIVESIELRNLVFDGGQGTKDSGFTHCRIRPHGDQIFLSVLKNEHTKLEILMFSEQTSASGEISLNRTLKDKSGELNRIKLIAPVVGRLDKTQRFEFEFIHNSTDVLQVGVRRIKKVEFNLGDQEHPNWVVDDELVYEFSCIRTY